MDSRARELVRIGDTLFSKKQQWDALCQELAEHFYPLRADFTQSFTLGEDFSLDTYDSYPQQARETLANLPNAVLRQDEWFEVRTGDEATDEQHEKWLESATKRFRTLIYDRRANFVKATTEADHDWVTFGNPVLSVEESSTRAHMLFKAWHPKECAWMENADGAIDHNQRKVPMTARAVIQRWKGNVHPEIRRIAEKDPTKDVKVRHIVLPTDEIYGDDKKMRRKYAKMPFVSLYIDCDNEHIMGEGGLPVLTYVIPRWRPLSCWPQGFSPATIAALPDARGLQALARIVIEQGEKAVDPPTVAKGDIFRDAVNLYAGGMTYVDMDDSDDIRKIFQTVESGSNLSIGMEMKQDARNLIAEAFLLNKLMLPDAREMTAFETNARLEEFRRAALPFFGPIESEYHLPLLDTAFQLAMHSERLSFEDMPDELADADVTFTFESPLNTAEGRKHVLAFQESVQIIAASAQFDKKVVAKYNFGKMTEDAVKGTGAPLDWENDEETQLGEEEITRRVSGLETAAGMLQGGAEVAGSVADAAMKMKLAGLAP